MPIRKPTFVVVMGGTIYTGDRFNGLSVPTGGANILSATNEVRMQPAFGKVYFVDGANYAVYDNATNTVSAWAANSPGVLPSNGTNRPTIIVLYRGRIVLAGEVGDPQNWFMSASGDPLNWDYNPNPALETQAVAGNNSVAGRVGDIITCLAPYGDDLMIMGGDHTLWILRGDPAAGGRIDNLSYKTGISGPDAATFDPSGILYFFGAGTLWRMIPGQAQPEPISRYRLDRTFGNIDLTVYNIKLAWDTVRRGLLMFVVPKTGAGPSTHYWWDQKTDGFWPLQMPSDVGPSAVYSYDGDNPGDTAILLGGWDRYIRSLDPLSKTDTGETIVSRVKYPPIVSPNIDLNLRMNRMNILMDTHSNDIVLKAFTNDSPQGAVEQTTPRIQHVLRAGRNTVINRVNGNVVVLEMSNDVNNTSWAVDGIEVAQKPSGRTRHGSL
jgi:hypothetical protein